MSYELVVRSRAKADIRRAKWYEKQLEGLGEDFVFEVDNAIPRIEANPEQFQVIYRDIRHAITRRFLRCVLSDPQDQNRNLCCHTSRAVRRSLEGET